jgi:hypothetical protein
MRRRSSVEWLAGVVTATRRAPWLAAGCLAALVLACYGRVLFGKQQFAFRDTAHFYYPLYWRVQQEWSAGRLPLWEPGANGGLPMLGRPMAAVLYPAKLLFALVPFSWGMRLYTIGHEVFAFWAMAALMRSWGVSRTGATLAGLSYAFGGTVLSGYFNIIYLVGAAWIPLGFRAADRWLRLGRRRGLVELVLVLAMQILGGDPQAAYLTLLCAFGYAAGLSRRQSEDRARPSAWLLGLAAVGIAWIWAGPPLSRLVRAGDGMGQGFLLTAWVFLAASYVATRRCGRLAAGLAGLGLAGLLALLVTAAQVFPVVEHIAGSVRWAGGSTEDLFDSSLLPYRALEWLWPNVFGTFTAGNRYWIPVLPPVGAQRPSPLSLYGGALPMVLALGAAGFRGGPRAWVTAVVLLSFLGSLGQFAGPSGWSVEVGRGDGAGAVGSLREVGQDSFYGLLTTALPALRLFRFPFKLLSFTSLGLAALAGLGWDQLATSDGRQRTRAIAVALLMLTGLGLATTVAMRDHLTAAIASRGADHAVFGPLDEAGAVGAMERGFIHGAVALGAGLALIVGSAGRRRAIVGALAVILLTIDLAVADSPLIVSIPQAEFEREPEVLRAIREAERTDPSPGPFRIQRLPSWVPIGWASSSSLRRLRELVEWEIRTLQPNFGWLHGVDYVFEDESRTARAEWTRQAESAHRRLDPSLAEALGVEPGRPVLDHPRAIYDLWGARYFILPAFPGDWTRPNRSYAAFVDQTDLIYPAPGTFEGPGALQGRQRWLLDQDVVVRRNRRAFPRAWVVRAVQVIRPLGPDDSARRDGLIARLRSAEPLSDGVNLRRTAYVETEDPKALGAQLRGSRADTVPPSTEADDAVIVRPLSPTRLVIEADLRRPGLVVLADVMEPGWRLTIDGRPAPILRANLLMRAAVVGAGKHTLVYTYDPASVRVGAWISLAGVLCLVLMAGWARASRAN